MLIARARPSRRRCCPGLRQAPTHSVHESQALAGNRTGTVNLGKSLLPRASVPQLPRLAHMYCVHLAVQHMPQRLATRLVAHWANRCEMCSVVARALASPDSLHSARLGLTPALVRRALALAECGARPPTSAGSTLTARGMAREVQTAATAPGPDARPPPPVAVDADSDDSEIDEATAERGVRRASLRRL